MILIAVRDLLFASKIDAAAKRLDVEVAWAPRGAPLSAAAAEKRPDVILADLGERGAMAELRAILAERPGTEVVGFLGHLQEDLMDEARAMGVGEVLTRGQLAASLDRVLLRAR
jgi:DNA-binding NarL/FixJ family response regulator